MIDRSLKFLDTHTKLYELDDLKGIIWLPRPSLGRVKKPPLLSEGRIGLQRVWDDTLLSLLDLKEQSMI